METFPFIVSEDDAKFARGFEYSTAEADPLVIHATMQRLMHEYAGAGPTTNPNMMVSRTAETGKTHVFFTADYA